MEEEKERGKEGRKREKEGGERGREGGRDKGGREERKNRIQKDSDTESF